MRRSPSMQGSSPPPTGWKSWLVVAVLVGLLYAVVGVTFALPGTHALVWRRAAWGVSSAFFLAHAAYEHFALQHTPRLAAVHVALAAAIGAFGLALAANIHSMRAQTNQQRVLLLASLVLWPVITAVPAFLVALGINGVLSRLNQRAARADDT